MSVRPPSNDDDDTNAIEFGIAALDAKLDRAEIEYPATDQEVRDQVGSVSVPFDPAGHSITVAEALDEATHKHYDNEQDLLNALHPVFERKRSERTTSLLAQLRSLVPF